MVDIGGQPWSVMMATTEDNLMALEDDLGCGTTGYFWNMEFVALYNF